VDQVWATDITYIAAAERLPHLVAVVDLFPGHYSVGKLTGPPLTRNSAWSLEMAFLLWEKKPQSSTRSGGQLVSSVVVATPHSLRILDDEARHQRRWPFARM